MKHVFITKITKKNGKGKLKTQIIEKNKNRHLKFPHFEGESILEFIEQIRFRETIPANN